MNWRDGERSWTEQTPADLDSSAGGFGGVHANPANPDGFLYESTIFWHHPADACYGEAGWGLAAISATGAVTESMVISMLVDIRHLSAIDRIMQAIAGISELVCDGGKGFLCSGEPAYLEGRKLLEGSLDFQALEEVALMHDGVLAIDETYRLDASGTDSDLARTIGPKAPPVIDGLDRHRSWIDVEF